MDRKINIFDMIGSLIPGYTGYADREGRRNSDKILRECISNDLSSIEKTIYERINSSLFETNLGLAKDLEENRKKVNTLLSKVKYSSHGATAFFTDGQIKEDELLQIYQIDMQVMENITDFKRQVRDADPSEIKTVMASIQDTLNKRDNLINKLK